VNFEDAASVELALKKEGTELRSRALRVSRCVKKLKVKNPENFVKGQNQHQPVKQEYGAAKRISMKNKFQGNAVPSGPSAAKSFSKFPNKGKQISQGRRQRKEAYSGDMTAELGKFKVIFNLLIEFLNNSIICLNTYCDNLFAFRETQGNPTKWN